MKTINCEAELLPDGHLVLPPEIVKLIKIRANKSNKKRIIIFDEEPGSDRLSQFCGKWQDARDADTIIAEIRADREKNRRSENIGL